MKPLAGISERRRFISFLAVGGFAAVINLTSRYLLDIVIGYSLAIVIAYLIGMLTAFVLSKRLVFERSKLTTSTELTRFAIVNLLAVIQVWAVSIGLAEWLFPALGIERHRYDIAHAIGVTVPVFTSYLGHKYYSFAAHSTD